MMTSSNENIFRVTGPLCVEFFKKSWGWWFETPSRPSRRHCNVFEILDDTELQPFIVLAHLKHYRIF